MPSRPPPRCPRPPGLNPSATGGGVQSPAGGGGATPSSGNPSGRGCGGHGTTAAARPARSRAHRLLRVDEGQDARGQRRLRACQLLAVLAEQQEVGPVGRRVTPEQRGPVLGSGRAPALGHELRGDVLQAVPGEEHGVGLEPELQREERAEHRPDDGEVEERPQEDSREERGAQPHGHQPSALRISM